MALAAGQTYRGVTNVVFEDVNPAFGSLAGPISWTPPSDMTDVDGYRFLITTNADGGIVDGGTPDLSRLRELEHPGLGGLLDRTYTNFTLADTLRQALIYVPDITPPRYLQVYTIIDGQWQYASELAPSAIIPIYDRGGNFSTLPLEAQHGVFADADPRCGYVDGGLSFVVPSDADFTYISSWRIFFAEDSMGTNPTSTLELPFALSNFINLSDYEIGSRSVLIIAGATDTGDITLPIADIDACSNTTSRVGQTVSNASIPVGWLLADSGSGPPERSSHASAMEGGRFWVFGGADYEGRDKSDLWHYAVEAGWTLVDQGSGPSARSLHSAAAADGRLWIFGGLQFSTSLVLGDLWYFEGEAWVQVDAGSAGSPSPRFNHYSAMALPNRLWLFGGGRDGTWERLSDLWYFTPDVGWTSLPSGSGTWPSARQAGAAEADSSGRFWVFGGVNASLHHMNDLWHFMVEAGWTLADAGSGLAPSPREGCSSAMDAAGRFWLFGGYDDATFFDDLWYFAEAVWVRADSSAWPAWAWPAPRTLHSSAMDASGRFWLFGGYNGTTFGTCCTMNDLWCFSAEIQSSTTITTSLSSTTCVDAAAWFQVESGSGPSERYSHASAMEGGRFWVFGGTDHSGRDKSDLWHYTVEDAWTLVDQGSGPSARWLHSAAAADGRLWIFGGYQQGTFSVFGDLWYFQDQAWTEVAEAGSPSPRFGHVSAMALNRFWIFGGNDFRVDGLNDLWYFTPDVGWTSLPSGSGTWPSARQAGAAEADSSGRFWIFGGENAPFNAPFMSNDLWHFTVEAGWTLADAGSGSAPSVRAGCSSAMDAVGRLWLFGGHNYAAMLDDLWYFAEAWMQADSPGLWPPPRFVHSSATDTSGRFWLFGGYNGTFGSCCTMNDLWYFGPEIQSSTTTTTSQTTATSSSTASMSTTTTATPTTSSSTTWVDAAAWFQVESGSGPSERYSHASAMEGGRFWVFGGTDHSGRDKSDLWHYTVEDAWTLVDQGSGPSARWLHSAAAADGRLWIFGGYQQGTFSVFGDLWYIQDQAWTEVAEAGSPSPRFGHVSAMALNRFWIFGGNDFRVDGLNDLWYFTPDVGWTSLPSGSGTWPSARQAGAAEADSSGRFWIFGGENAPFNAPFMSNDLWHFTVEAGWTLADAGSGSAPSVRAGCSSAMDAVGRLWLFGGHNYAAMLDDLWYFAEAWMQADSPGLWPPPRFVHSSVMDSSGRFWLFGGYNGTFGSCCTMNDLWYFGPEIQSSTTTTTSQTTTTSSSTASLSTTTKTAVVAWFQADGSGSGPNGRSSQAAASEGGRFWVFGGLDQSGGNKRDLWHYTPEAAWTLVDEGSGPAARHLHSAAADEGRLWIFGGRGSSDFGDLWYFEADRINPERQAWSQVAALGGSEPSPRRAHFSAMALNRFWVFAGRVEEPRLQELFSGALALGFRGEEFHNDLWHFTVEANWTLVDDGGSGPSGRAGCSAAMDAAGRFWLFGGFAINGEPLDDLWYFAEAWIQADSPGLWPPARFAHSSAMDASGRFWLFGGRADGTAGSTVRTNDLWYFEIINQSMPEVKAEAWLKRFDDRRLTKAHNFTQHVFHKHAHNFKQYFFHKHASGPDSLQSTENVAMANIFKIACAQAHHFKRFFHNFKHFFHKHASGPDSVQSTTAAKRTVAIENILKIAWAQACVFKQHFFHKQASGPDSAQPAAAKRTVAWAQAHNFKQYFFHKHVVWSQAHNNFKQHFFHKHASGPDSVQSTENVAMANILKIACAQAHHFKHFFHEQAHNFKHFFHKHASGPDSVQSTAAAKRTVAIENILKIAWAQACVFKQHFFHKQAHNFKQYFFHKHASGPDSLQSTENEYNFKHFFHKHAHNNFKQHFFHKHASGPDSVQSTENGSLAGDGEEVQSASLTVLLSLGFCCSLGACCCAWVYRVRVRRRLKASKVQADEEDFCQVLPSDSAGESAASDHHRFIQELAQVAADNASDPDMESLIAQVFKGWEERQCAKRGIEQSSEMAAQLHDTLASFQTLVLRELDAVNNADMADSTEGAERLYAAFLQAWEEVTHGADADRTMHKNEQVEVMPGPPDSEASDELQAVEVIKSPLDMEVEDCKAIPASGQDDVKVDRAPSDSIESAQLIPVPNEGVLADAAAASPSGVKNEDGHQLARELAQVAADNASDPEMESLIAQVFKGWEERQCAKRGIEQSSEMAAQLHDTLASFQTLVLRELDAVNNADMADSTAGAEPLYTALLQAWKEVAHGADVDGTMHSLRSEQGAQAAQVETSRGVGDEMRRSSRVQDKSCEPAPHENAVTQESCEDAGSGRLSQGFERLLEACLKKTSPDVRMDIVKAWDWKELAGDAHAEDMATFVQALFDCADVQGGLENSDVDLLRAQVMEHWQLLTAQLLTQETTTTREQNLAKSKAEAEGGKRVGEDPEMQPVPGSREAEAAFAAFRVQLRLCLFDSQEPVGDVGASDGKVPPDPIWKPSPQPQLARSEEQVQLGPEVFRTSSKLLTELSDLFENAWARPGADFQPEVLSICETWKRKLLKLHAGAPGLETWIDAVLHSVNTALQLEAGTAEGTLRGDVDTGRLQKKLQEAVQKHIPAALKATPKERSTSSRQPARLREKRNRALLTAGDLLTQEK
ncbi:GPA3 [Symbiodinium sp. CCMP2592]|nr:GPA3 [Symbiodinium sp. CCMP2592]